MYADSRKMHIVEAVLKADDEEILLKLEEVIESGKTEKKRSVNDFVGIWNKEEAETIEKIIEEGCEQIHPDE